MKKQILSLLLVLALLGTLLPFGAFAEETSVTGTGILSISKYGILKLQMSHDDILSVFDFGDVVTVKLGSIVFDAPIVTAYSCVDTGALGVFLQHEGDVEEVKLGINKGNFAGDFGVAVRPDPENAPTDWEYLEGFSADMSYTFTLKEKGAYREEYLLRGMEYTNNREDYPNLTDAEFANFRPVVMGSIAPGVLYRSATPVDPKNNRNTYSDAAAREAGVTVFIDLADTESALPEFEGYSDSWFASQKHIALNMTVDFTTEDNRQKLAQGLRYMAQNPGVYDVFCVEGKDRTGLAMALLEALMGAAPEEICEDYMLSFKNYYGVEYGTESYKAVLEGNLLKDIALLAGTEISSPEAAAAAYLLDLGLTEEEIAALKTNLSTPVEAPQSEPVPETTAAPTSAPTAAPEAPAQPAETPKKSGSNTVILVLCIIAGFSVGILIAPKLTKKKQ